MYYDKLYSVVGAHSCQQLHWKIIKRPEENKRSLKNCYSAVKKAKKSFTVVLSQHERCHNYLQPIFSPQVFFFVKEKNNKLSYITFWTFSNEQKRLFCIIFLLLHNFILFFLCKGKTLFSYLLYFFFTGNDLKYAILMAHYS